MSAGTMISDSCGTHRRATSPLASPRSAIEEGDEAASSAAAAEGVDLPGGSRVDLPAAQSSDAPKTIPRSLIKKLSGQFPTSLAPSFWHLTGPHSYISALNFQGYRAYREYAHMQQTHL